MKLSDLFKRRILQRFEPDYIQPTTEGFQVPTPPRPKPQPSKLLRTLQGVAPKPPVYDYAHFELTELFKAIFHEARDGQIRMLVDCFDSDDKILVDELVEWKPWLRAQGIKIEFIDEPPVLSEDYYKYYVISWGEN